MADLPDIDQTEISVMTLAELTIGVLVASARDRPRRLATLSALEEAFEPLPVNAEVARAFARIVGEVRSEGGRIPVIDALIAATAVAEGIPVVTQDRDFQTIPGVETIRV